MGSPAGLRPAVLGPWSNRTRGKKPRFGIGRGCGVKILVLNCGSSSLKSALFDGDRRVRGEAVSGIGVPQGKATHVDAVHEVLDATPQLEAVGHRVVHGGPALR